MAEHKDQHYIPQFYMKNFSDDNGFFNVYNIKDRRIINKTKYRNHCYKKYFYGKDTVIEKDLGIKENLWSATITEALSSSPLTSENIRLLKEFAVYQHQRTLSANEYYRKAVKETFEQSFQMFYLSTGYKYNPEILDKQIDEDINPSYNIEMATRCTKYLEDLDVVIIHYDTENKLISSDMPVVALNPFYNHLIGYGCIGFIMIYPISSEKLVVIYDSKMYPKFKNKQYIHSSNEKEVIALNKLQLISADKILFSLYSQQFVFSNEDFNLRLKSTKDKVTQNVGTPFSPTIIFTTRNVLLDFEFSFGKIAKSFQKIPSVCRDNPSRKRDKDWERKFRNKASILKMSSDFYNNNLTKKEWDRGCKLMLQTTKKYWNNYRL